MSERRNPDGSVSVGILEDMKPAKVEEVKEESAEKPKKKATKKK